VAIISLGEDSMILLKVIDNVDSFLSLLQSDNEKSNRLGFAKLSIIQFLHTVSNEEPDICTILIENGFYSWYDLAVMVLMIAISSNIRSFLDLLFKYPSNSILHDTVLQLFLLLCNRDENEMMEALIQTNLLDKIGMTDYSI
jgi:hypothetical protein